MIFIKDNEFNLVLFSFFLIVYEGPIINKT